MAHESQQLGNLATSERLKKALALWHRLYDLNLASAPLGLVYWRYALMKRTVDYLPSSTAHGQRDYQLERARKAPYIQQTGVEDLFARVRDGLYRRLAGNREVIDGLGGRLRHAMCRTLTDRCARLQNAEVKLSQAWHRLGHTALDRWGEAPAFRYSGMLGERDRHLVDKWSEDGKITRGRLEAARFAELTALAYYRRLEDEVEDVSILQLEEPSGRWQTHDLEVAGCYLDVKSTRTRGDRHFRDLFTKRDKESQGVPVDITAVAVKCESPGFSGTVLGESNHAALKGLLSCVRDEAERLGVVLEADLSPRGARWRPPWVFEYPGGQYLAREILDDICRWRRVARVFDSTVPHWLAAIVVATGGSFSIGAESSLHEEFVQNLGRFAASVRQRNRVADRFGRPHVFLFSLLQVLARPKSETVEALRDCLFVDRACRAQVHPLGLDDPLRQGWHLLRNLESILQHNSSVFANARSFQLAGAEILRAKLDDGTWRTLLAYCGSCGRTPLWLGRPDDGGCRGCPCGAHRLLCDECHSCGRHDCRGHHFESRQKAHDWAKEHSGWVVDGCRVSPPDTSLPPVAVYRHGPN